MKHLLPNTALTTLPEYTLVAFFLFFTIMVCWVMRPGAKEKYNEAGRLPLESDNER